MVVLCATSVSGMERQKKRARDDSEEGKDVGRGEGRG